MGTPDTFVIVDPEDAKKFLNGNGIPLFDVPLQSNHFDNCMNSYYIFGGTAFVYESRHRGPDGIMKYREPKRSWKLTEEGVLIESKVLMRSTLNNSGLVCCQDKLTKPVLALSDGIFRGGYIHERFPWCEWEIEFKDGELIRVTPKKVQTRDDLIAEVKQTFSDVLLSDDHPIAIKHFYDWEMARGANGS